MYQRVLKLRDAITLFQNTEEGQEHEISFSTAEWTMIEEASMILEPAFDITVEICAEKYVTASKIVPLAKILLQGYSEMSRTAQAEQNGLFKHKFAEAMYKSLSNHLARAEELDLLRVATVSDPRWVAIIILHKQGEPSGLGPGFG